MTATTTTRPASKPTTTRPAPKPRSKRDQQTIDRIRADSKKLDQMKKEIAKLQARNDANVLRARKAGLKFREIADASGRSVSWVQAVIKRNSPNGEVTPVPATTEPEEVSV